MKNTIFSILLLMPISSLGSVTSITTIQEYMLDQGNGTKIFLKPTQPIPIGNNCRANLNWPYVIDISTDFGRYMFSSVIAAYAAKQQIIIYGSDTCELHGGVETVRRIEFK